MKLFRVDFEGMYPVPCGLIISAVDNNKALEIALETIQHKQSEPITIEDITELNISKNEVIFYESGDY